MGSRLIAVLLFFVFSGACIGQASIRDSAITTYIVSGYFGTGLAQGDLADRFGSHGLVGGSFQYKSAKNFLLSLEANFLFGTNVKEDNMLDGLRTASGQIIDQNGGFANIAFSERAYFFGLSAGKQFDWLGPNANSGIYFQAGLGFFQHKIRIDVANDNVPALVGAYLVGYDRLSSGLGLIQTVGYRHLSNGRLVNFFVCLDAMEAFTKNRRPYNFDTMMKDDTPRLDVTLGTRIGWSFLIYKRAPKEFYFN